MNWLRTFVLAMMIFACIAGTNAAPVPESVPESWLGEWLVTTYNHGGADMLSLKLYLDRPNPPKVIKITPTTMTFDFRPDRVVVCSYKVDLEKMPHYIDFTVTDPKDGGKASGIISVNGDELKICRGANAFIPRPDSFDLPPGFRETLLICKRVRKPEK